MDVASVEYFTLTQHPEIFVFEFLLRFNFSGGAVVCTSHLILAQVLFELT